MRASPARPPEDNSSSTGKSAEELRIENEQLRDLIIQLSSIVARHAIQRR